MDGLRFDHWTKVWTQAASRRGVLRGLGLASLGAFLGRHGSGAAAAQGGPPCVGQDCLNGDVDCCGGTVCVGEVCVAAAGRCDRPGAACETDDACCGTEGCSNGVCQRGGSCPLGQPCSGDADCCGGEGCFDGTCQALARPGNCPDGEVFCSGGGCCRGGRICRQGACVCPLSAPDEPEGPDGPCACFTVGNVCAAGEVCCFNGACASDVSASCYRNCADGKIARCVASGVDPITCRNGVARRCCNRSCACLGLACETNDDCCTDNCSGGICVE
jgi:hypothetical protein